MQHPVIDYSPGLTIRNTEQLPKGTGCRYLLVIGSPYPGEYIAKRWLRQLPDNVLKGEAIIRF